MPRGGALSAAGGFQAQRLGLVPEAWRPRVAGDYARKLAKIEAIPYGKGARTKAEQSANAWLLNVTGIFERVRFLPGVTEGDIRDKAAECAAQAFALAEITPGHFLASVGALRERLAGFAESFGVVPPGEKVKDGPAIARLTCPIWWRRALRIAQARQLERGAITLGYVHKKAEIYASNATVSRRIEQRRRNAAMLEATTARNMETGQEFTLAELAAVSVANPAIRRGELMTRISGFEHVAKAAGHVAEFVTLTAPSRFHRMRQGKAGQVEPNEKHDGSSPRDAQQYLVRVWAMIRAKLARMGLKVYGFRIAEPHHDACPHWHLLLFIPPMLRAGASSLGRFRAIFRRYALRDSGDEAGAKKYRVAFERIDMARGSAAGYVLKYISKNIDGNGYEVQGDIEGGHDAIYPGQRVEAWASTWGIRQFQQIGGPPVGVWRELRRMKPGEELPALVNEAIAAADCGKNSEAGKTAEHWARFVGVMGGPVVARAALPLRVAYREQAGQVDDETGESLPKRTIYGEEAAPVPCGVRWLELVGVREGIAAYSVPVWRVAESVRYQWEIKRPAVESAKPIRALAAEGLGFGKGEARAARTGVNNCTRTIETDGAFCLVGRFFNNGAWEWVAGQWSERSENGRKSEKGGGSGQKRGESSAFAGRGAGGDCRVS